MILLLATTASGASLSEVESALAACSTGPTHALPTLSAKQRQELVAGEVVRILDKATDPDQPSAAVGIAVLSASVSALRIAAQDPHTIVDESLTEFVVESLGADRALWYGYYDLPSPVRDRQWVIESSNNHALATATDGRCWEHAWTLVPDGLERVRATVASEQPNGITPDHLDRAIFTPTNDGSWFMAPISDGEVMVAYQARSVVGGAIPDWLVAQIAMSRLESVLRRLEDRARTWAPAHYAGTHEPVPGGDGEPIERFVP